MSKLPVKKVDTHDTMTFKGNSEGKNPAAVYLGRLGGLKGGKARAEKLSQERRTEIARNAAEARWNQKPK